MSRFVPEAAFAAVLWLCVPAGVAIAQAPAPAPSGQSHGQGGHGEERQEPKPAPPQDHATDQKPDQPEPPPGLPPINDADRAAAFPELNGQHTVHDDAVHYYVLFDRIEWQAGEGVTAGKWDNSGWIGKDVNRFWFRTEGEAEEGDLASAQAHALYGRAIHRWWDLVVGVRQDFRPGPQRTWAAVGVQGLAPYWFQLEATAYVGESGRTHFRFETEYDLLFTNRLILQPRGELELYGKSDPERGIGAGLSSMEAGLRLRYEFRRELAPYVGVTWNRKFFGTADLAESAGDAKSRTKLALGVRVWF